MKIEHVVDNEKNIVTVKAVIAPRQTNKIVIRQDDIREYLVGKVKIGNCLQNNTVSNNIAPHCGEWVFELDIAPKPVVKLRNEKVKPRTRRKNITTTEGDASKIIANEEKTQRKKGRSSKRTTTNSASKV